MKKILSLILVSACLLTAVSCGKDPSRQMIDELYVTRTVEELYDLDNVVSVDEIAPSVWNSGIVCYDVVFSTRELETETYFVLPEDYEKKKYPAILWLPDATVSDYRFMNMINAGYIVIAVFSRGYEDSRSEGNTDFGGDGDLSDIEALMELIGQCEFIDQSRIYTVSNLFKSIAVFRYLAGDSGDKIRGAAFARPMTDIIKFYNDVPQENREAFAKYQIGGTIEEVPEEYEKRSVLSCIEDIETPILVGVFENGDKAYAMKDEEYYSEALIEKLEEYGKKYEVQRYDFASTDFYLPDAENGLIGWMDSLK
ncbi:MAG: hypothetical protein IJT91_04625 [Clostridia bacterium]|nr:hypothetical protein [Clostridia bacterium]